MLLSAIHKTRKFRGLSPRVNYKLINSVWNKEELPDQWKESTIVPVYRKDDKTDCGNYHGITLLSTS
jgi:hypothetical protein